MMDTLKLSRRLEGAGMDRRPAEELADALADGLREAVVERIDRLQASMDSRFERMRAQIDARFERVQAQVDVLKSDIIDLKADVRLLEWGNGVVLAGVVAILRKLFLG